MYRKKEVVSFSWSRLGNSPFLVVFPRRFIERRKSCNKEVTRQVKNKYFGGLTSLSPCTSLLKAGGRRMPAYSSRDSFVLEYLNCVLSFS